jgi:hypothetical protein
MLPVFNYDRDSMEKYLEKIKDDRVQIWEMNIIKSKFYIMSF